MPANLLGTMDDDGVRTTDPCLSLLTSSFLLSAVQRFSLVSTHVQRTSFVVTFERSFPCLSCSREGSLVKEICFLSSHRLNTCSINALQFIFCALSHYFGFQLCHSSNFSLATSTQWKITFTETFRTTRKRRREGGGGGVRPWCGLRCVCGAL